MSKLSENNQDSMKRLKTYPKNRVNSFDRLSRLIRSIELTQAINRANSPLPPSAEFVKNSDLTRGQSPLFMVKVVRKRSDKRYGTRYDERY